MEWRGQGQFGRIARLRREGRTRWFGESTRVTTTRVLSEPAEAVFQIEGTPNDDMLGASQLLLKAARLKALDNFTGLDLQSVAGSVTSAVVGAISGIRCG